MLIDQIPPHPHSPWRFLCPPPPFCQLTPTSRGLGLETQAPRFESSTNTPLRTLGKSLSSGLLTCDRGLGSSHLTEQERACCETVHVKLSLTIKHSTAFKQQPVFESQLPHILTV